MFIMVEIYVRAARIVEPSAPAFQPWTAVLAKLQTSVRSNGPTGPNTPPWQYWGPAIDAITNPAAPGWKEAD